MIARGFILFGIFFAALTYAQEPQPVYRAFYPHQIAEAILNGEILPAAIKNGFITYHKEDGTVAKIFFPKETIKTSTDLRLWFMMEAEKLTQEVGKEKAQAHIKGIISDHLSGGYKIHAGGQPLLGFSTASEGAAMHISMRGLGSGFSGHAPCAVIEIIPGDGGLCRPKDFLSPHDLKKTADGIVSRNPALDSKSIVQSMNAEAIMLGIKKDEIQSFIFRQSTADGKVVTRTIPASDIFKLFDDYEGLLTPNETQGIFDSVFHKSALTPHSKSSYNPSFDPLDEFKRRITATVEAKTNTPAPHALKIMEALPPHPISMAQLQKAESLYLSLQNNPALGTSPAHRSHLLERKINTPLKQLISQANKGVDVSRETDKLIIIADALKKDPDNINRLATGIQSAPINASLTSLTADIRAINTAPQINAVPNKRAGFIALGDPSLPVVGGMRASRPSRTIETSFPDAIAQGKTQKSKPSVTRLDTTPFNPQTWEKNNAFVVEPHSGSSIAAQAEAARKASASVRASAVRMTGIKSVFQKTISFLTIGLAGVDIIQGGFLTYDELSARITFFESILGNPENISAMHRQIERGNYDLSKQYKALSDELRDLKKDKAVMDQKDTEMLQKMTPEEINDLYLRRSGVI